MDGKFLSTQLLSEELARAVCHSTICVAKGVLQESESTLCKPILRVALQMI
jgi:hypothetical protein